VRRLLLPLCALATLGAAAPAAAFTESELRSKLAREMRLTGSASGALVRDLDSGATLYARRADAPRIPASVEKLFVTSARRA
jgi:D-alanyl-D-alanine carboxypeptidase/D-alanyl-D-alanine-endopeptidase (penicillin-binding protein 4)